RSLSHLAHKANKRASKQANKQTVKNIILRHFASDCSNLPQVKRIELSLRMPHCLSAVQKFASHRRIILTFCIGGESKLEPPQTTASPGAYAGSG
ncbi:hypothetical protein CEXT_218121, partial [Caerostris extrusa]